MNEWDSIENRLSSIESRPMDLNEEIKITPQGNQQDS